MTPCNLVETQRHFWNVILPFSVTLTPWSRVILDKLTVPQLSKIFSAILWNTNIQHRFHKIPQPVTVISQNNTAHKTHFNIILSSTPRNSKPLKISSPKFQYAFPLFHARHMPQPSSSILSILRAPLVHHYNPQGTPCTSLQSSGHPLYNIIRDTVPNI